MCLRKQFMGVKVAIIVLIDIYVPHHQMEEKYKEQRCLLILEMNH